MDFQMSEEMKLLMLLWFLQLSSRKDPEWNMKKAQRDPLTSRVHKVICHGWYAVREELDISVQSVEPIRLVRVSKKSAWSSMSCCFVSNSADRLVSNVNFDKVTSLIRQIKSFKFVSLLKPLFFISVSQNISIVTAA